MPDTGIAQTLGYDHRVIDDGLAAFVAGLRDGRIEPDGARQAVAALRLHIYVEEQHLFGPLRAAGAFGPILVMLKEHGLIWDALDTLEAELDGGDPSPAGLLQVWDELAPVLEAHNLKEEQILYPMADQALQAEESVAVLRALGGEFPDGWVCEQAGA